MQLAISSSKAVRSDPVLTIALNTVKTPFTHTLVSKQLRRAALRSSVACCVLIALVASLSATAMSTEESIKPAAPEQKWLNTEQIESYLTGYFVKGVFHGTKWSSFFAASGSTTFLAESRPPAYGEWKAENDRYCSQWPPSGGWECYKISAEGNNMTFVPLDGGDHWPGIRSRE